MRSKRRNTNIKILQRQLQNFTLSEEKEQKEQAKPIQTPVNEETPKELPVVNKIKKKGIPKDELINTKRLLTQ